MKKEYQLVVILLVMALLAACSGKLESAAPIEKKPTLVGEEYLKEVELTTEIAPAKTPPPFCEDQRVMDFVEIFFIPGVQKEDSETWGGALTYRSGLNIRLSWWNTNVHFSKEEAMALYEDDTVYDWGIADGSGAPIQGTFMDVVHPQLQNVFAEEYVIRCDTLEPGVASGPSAGLVEWPEDIPAQHFIAIYRPAPEGQDMDWRTWVIGFEYVENVPYISYLIQYQWEI